MLRDCCCCYGLDEFRGRVLKEDGSRTSQPTEHETSLQSMVFQLATHPPFPAFDMDTKTESAPVVLIKLDSIKKSIEVKECGEIATSISSPSSPAFSSRIRTFHI
ncbi:hypothetical protein Prudu_1488S000700 [Prunus dulcis]|uniref:Uncharacterized protein n=1 Tax=Prunus dulcis TaxID=3755 RepID=A0A5H2XY23_PRUDU|nr:hypothetical protein Prudu_1488S000700 [Prunus dulcis]